MTAFSVNSSGGKDVHWSGPSCSDIFPSTSSLGRCQRTASRPSYSFYDSSASALRTARILQVFGQARVHPDYDKSLVEEIEGEYDRERRSAELNSDDSCFVCGERIVVVKSADMAFLISGHSVVATSRRGSMARLS